MEKRPSDDPLAPGSEPEANRAAGLLGRQRPFNLNYGSRRPKQSAHRSMGDPPSYRAVHQPINHSIEASIDSAARRYERECSIAAVLSIDHFVDVAPVPFIRTRISPSIDPSINLRGFDLSQLHLGRITLIAGEGRACLRRTPSRLVRQRSARSIERLKSLITFREGQQEGVGHVLTAGFC